MNILVIDIGGTNVKLLATAQADPKKYPSGPEMTPEERGAGGLEAAKDREFEAISPGFPAPVLCGQPMTEPVNLDPGGRGFDFAAAFGRPVVLGGNAEKLDPLPSGTRLGDNSFAFLGGFACGSEIRAFRHRSPTRTIRTNPSGKNCRPGDAHGGRPRRPDLPTYL